MTSSFMRTRPLAFMFTIYPNTALTVRAAVDTDGDLLDKVASDLQSNVTIGYNTISGELNYIDDYSSAGYTGDEESGHFLALHCQGAEDAVITAEVIGGTHGEVTLDPDGLLISRISSTSQKIRITATKNEQSKTRIYYLDNLVLKPEEEE